MNFIDEITLNQIRQNLLNKEDAKNWFFNLSIEHQKAILQRLSYLVLQAGTRDGDVNIAIKKSNLRPTYTPCILLSQGRIKEQIAKVLKLPNSEFLKAFILLITLFEIADTRRYNNSCQDGCTHWWHRDLSDRRVLAEIRAEFTQEMLV